MKHVTNDDIDKILDGFAICIKLLEELGVPKEKSMPYMFMTLATQVSTPVLKQACILHDATEKNPDPKSSLH